uniref:Qvr_1 protein n=1 Tax=Fopius arisanus TaxID=64838 RepID=A0A0C9QQ49_9HYME
MESKWIFWVLLVLSYSGIRVDGLLRRCVDCRSRGELGSCKDPFTMNATMIESEPGVDVVPCASGWCGKVIESPNLNNEYGTATQRMCLQRGPGDGEERCAYTIKNSKKVWMCFCNGDLCNTANSLSISGLFVFVMSLVALR